MSHDPMIDHASNSFSAASDVPLVNAVGKQEPLTVAPIRSHAEAGFFCEQVDSRLEAFSRPWSI
jgi:hypothetical protein